jgi:hypothetical protein
VFASFLVPGSMTAAVAVPVKMPADMPESSRPISSCPTPPANRKTIALASAKAVAANSIGRRPVASDPALRGLSRKRRADGQRTRLGAALRRVVSATVPPAVLALQYAVDQARCAHMGSSMSYQRKLSVG